MEDSASNSASGREASPASDIDIEIALLRSILETPPIGRHKHVIAIRIQGEIQRKTGVMLETEEIWSRLEELYDLEALDEQAATTSESIPSSPAPLSPLARNNHRTSLSPLSSPSPSPSGTSRPLSRSAAILNGKHFKRTFDIPYVGLEESDEDEAGKWKDMIYGRAEDDSVDKDWGAGEASAAPKNRTRDSPDKGSASGQKRGATKSKRRSDAQETLSQSVQDADSEDGDRAGNIEDEAEEDDPGQSSRRTSGSRRPSKASPAKLAVPSGPTTGRRRSTTAVGSTSGTATGRKGRERSSSLSEESEDETGAGKARKAVGKGATKRKRDSLDQDGGSVNGRGRGRRGGDDDEQSVEDVPRSDRRKKRR